LQGLSGSQYVNDFQTCLGPHYQVNRPGWTAASRRDGQDLMGLKARNSAGEMVPIGSVADLKSVNGAFTRVPRYILLPGGRGAGRRGTWHCHRHRPCNRNGGAGGAGPCRPAFGFEWTEIAYQQAAEGHTHLSRLWRPRPSLSSSCWPRSYESLEECRWRSY